MSYHSEFKSKQELIDQFCLEGKPWKLSKDCYRPGDVDNWEKCFLNDCEYRERHLITQTKIIWRSTDSQFSRGLDCPLYGVAGNIAQLQYVMKDDRIPRDELEIDPDIWNEILELKNEVIIPVRDDSVETDSSINRSSRSDGLHIDDFESTLETTKSSELETNETVKTPTPDYILEVLDKIVVYLTGRLYSTHLDIGTKYENYINDYDLNLKIMETFLRKGLSFLPEGLACQFKAGYMESWEEVIRELKYFFECDTRKNTIIELFNDLQDIAMRKDKTYNLLSEMRVKIQKYFITEPENFLTCQDSLTIKARQTIPEECGPMTNTLLLCIIYLNSQLEKSKWGEVHDRYLNFRPEHKFDEFQNYKMFHENRYDFFKLLDCANGIYPGSDMIYVNGNYTNDQGAKNIIESKSYQASLRATLRGTELDRNGGTFRYNDEIREKLPQIFRNTRNFNPHPPNNSNNSSRGINHDLPKCTHCTKHFGKTVRHIGPFQGRGDRCLFDVNGRRKPSICTKSEQDGRLVNIVKLSQNDDNGMREYTDTQNCIYIHSIFAKSNKEVQKRPTDNSSKGFGEPIKRAENKSRYTMKLNKKVERIPENSNKVEKVPRTVEERKFEGTNNNLTNESCENVTKVRKLRLHDDVSPLNLKSSSINSILRDEKLDKKYPVSESYGDNQVYIGGKARKRRYLDWNPYLRCKLLNPNKAGRYGSAKIDSGAYRSFIHKSNLQFFQVLKYEKCQNRAFGAGGQSIQLADYTVDIAMNIEDLGTFILRKVLVSTSQINVPSGSILLGLSDINRLKITMDFKTKRVKFGVGPNRGKWIKMKSSL